MLLVVGGVLLGSLSYQFFLGELPCPLCVIQRLAFLLACSGLLSVLLDTGAVPDPSGRNVRGFALCIVASLVGSAASIRQVLLHIVPPDAGYGPPVLGMHHYSWALVVFVCLILGSAIGLLGVFPESRPLPRVFRHGLAGFIMGLAAVVAVVTFAMQGFAFLLPDDPLTYHLFHQLHLIR